MAQIQTGPLSPKGTRYYEEYTEYAKTLRTWFVAYGIGGPVIYLTQKDVPQTIVKSGWGGTIAALFLVGVFIQIAATLLYKAATWRLHYHQDIAPSRLWKNDWAKCVERWYWIDVVFDGATTALFGVATWLTFRIVSG